MEAWSLNTFLICFGGGVVGTALGGLFSFSLCSLIVLSGCMLVLVGGPDVLLLQVGLGPVFGPHVGGFAAGCAAVTYAEGIRKNAPNGEGTGKDILSPLMQTSWDVLFVGGVFAVFGHVMVNILPHIPILNKTDGIAVTVVISCLLSRLLFQREMPWGKMESIKKNGLFGTDKGEISWLPWMTLSLPKLALFGLGVGLLSGGLAMGTKVVLDPMVANGQVNETAAFVVPLIICWALAGISLIGLNFATGKTQLFPAWHGLALPPALAFLFSGSLLIAGIVGILNALLQELLTRLFYNHGSNHIDPPANTIAWSTLFLGLIHSAGLFG